MKSIFLLQLYPRQFFLSKTKTKTKTKTLFKFVNDSIIKKIQTIQYSFIHIKIFIVC